MTLKEFLGCIRSADLIRIMDADSKKQIYAGYLGLLRFHVGGMDFQDECMGWAVKKIRIVQEIRHKQWKEKGLMPPLLPEQAPLYSFSDFQMTIYQEIWIEQSAAGAEEGGSNIEDNSSHDAERRCG